MKPYRGFIALAIVCEFVLLGPGLGRHSPPSAFGYGAGGMGASTLTFDPQRLAVQQGAAASAKVTVTLASGTTWATTLGAAGAPDGVTISFDPDSGDPTFTSTMAVRAAPTAQPGVYTVKVQATGDDPSAAVGYQLIISKPSSY